MNLRSLVLAFVFPWILSAQTPPISPRIERVAEAGRLWARLRWVHPTLVEGTVDWDQQLVDMLPVIAEAESAEAQKVALERWLSCLKDPALQVGPGAEPQYVKWDSKTPKIANLPGNGVLLSVHDTITALHPEFAKDIQAFRQALAGAKRLVVDLRPSEDHSYENATDYLKALLPGLIAKPLGLPSRRYIYNKGWAPQTFSANEDYYTAWLIKQVEQLQPEARPQSLPMAFIVDSQTIIPSQVLALQKSGLAFLVSVGAPSPKVWMPVESRPFNKNLEVTYRVGDWIFPDGTTGFGADQVLAPSSAVGPDSAAVQVALALLDSNQIPGAKIQWRRLSILPTRDQDKPYKEMVFPSLPWRQFAVIHFWSVIDTFFPYKDLMDSPWKEALPEFLAEMESVHDAAGYAQTLARMSARLQDNHVRVMGHPFLDGLLRGEAGLPISFRMVEGSILVDRILDVQAAQGIHRWDEILEVDGERVSAWMARIEPFVSSANAWTRDRNLVVRLGRGQDGCEARLKMRGADSAVRDFQIKRSKRFTAALPESLHTGEMIQVLPDGIGYVDLGRLFPSQVEQLFNQVKNTKALILDMRGYPNGTAWAIAPYLNVRKASVAAVFSPNTVNGADGADTDSSTAAFFQTLPPSNGKPLYSGKVVMLINEVTQSQAEHSGLFFETACGVTFIGSPSAGSNGDMTDFLLPGGIKVSFTGQGVKHADGRQLQRVGLQPQVFVRPTIKGVREGRDEVMERAIRFIREGH